MTTVIYTPTGWVPLAGVPVGPGPDPEDPKVPPPAVIILSATSPSSTELRVAWLAPEDPNAGGYISHYQVDFDGADYNWSLTGLTITIGDLEPDSQHTITVRAVNNFGLVGPDSTVTAWTQVEHPYDADLGAPGNRPPLTERPDETNTGPRQATTRTISSSTALAEILAAPVETDGFRYLRRARINGSINLQYAEHTNIVFEDCVIESTSTYCIRGFTSNETPSAAVPEFRYCEIRGGNSAVFYGGYARFLRCNMHRGEDIFKPARPNLEIYACYLHDNWHADGAHTDTIHIASGAENNLYHWNHLHGFNAPESPSAGGDVTSGVLQTGTVTRDIGPVEWRNNWANGGGYTIRGTKPGDDTYVIDMVFRNNRIGRGYRFGPLYRMDYPGPGAGFDFDDSNVWDDTGLPVD